VGVEDYIQLVVKGTRISKGRLFSKTHERPVVLARHILCWFLYTDLEMTLHAIGRVVGRDHSTISHGLALWKEQFAGLPFEEVVGNYQTLLEREKIERKCSEGMITFKLAVVEKIDGNRIQQCANGRCLVRNLTGAITFISQSRNGQALEECRSYIHDHA
jgi:hypothetical protein